MIPLPDLRDLADLSGLRLLDETMNQNNGGTRDDQRAMGGGDREGDMAAMVGRPQGLNTLWRVER